MEASTSLPTSDENLSCEGPVEIEFADDFSVLDGEVCRRLNHMTPVPHIPKINGDIPSVDEEISDHQRLLDRVTGPVLQKFPIGHRGKLGSARSGQPRRLTSFDCALNLKENSCKYAVVGDRTAGAWVTTWMSYRGTMPRGIVQRLNLYDLVELKVQGDGNCQFQALSDQFYRTPEHHKFVRDQVVDQLKSHREVYEGYVPMSFDEYLRKMCKSGEWGDHVTLQAAADSYGVKIFILTSFKDTCYIEILPSVEKSERVICLSFWAEVHYNSIYPEGEFPAMECKKKKKWWHFGI